MRHIAPHEHLPVPESMLAMPFGCFDQDTIVPDSNQELDPGNAGRLASADSLYAPQAAGDYLLWAVVYDNRAGAAWLAVPMHAK